MSSPFVHKSSLCTEDRVTATPEAQRSDYPQINMFKYQKIIHIALKMQILKRKNLQLLYVNMACQKYQCVSETF